MVLVDADRAGRWSMQIGCIPATRTKMASGRKRQHPTHFPSGCGSGFCASPSPGAGLDEVGARGKDADDRERGEQVALEDHVAERAQRREPAAEEAELGDEGVERDDVTVSTNRFTHVASVFFVCSKSCEKMLQK